MTQNDTSTPCEVCNGTGLAILPVRYTVVPASCPGAGLGPFPKGRGSKEDVSAAGYDYAVRTLRQGMLYLFYEQSGPYGSRQWEAYAVAENGTLWRQVSGYAARRIAGGGVPSCSRPVHNAERMEFITLRYPHLCGTVWVMFSEHLLTPATLKRYAADATLRAERMQPITPKQWIGAPQAKGDTVPLSSADALKAVLEYRGVAGEVSEPAQLPYLRQPRAISGKDGSYKADVLHANSTRYPWALRTHSMSGAS
ncbi:T6SS effector BTH_I2691 family protein, partial [Xanthomonas oryzae]